MKVGPFYIGRSKPHVEAQKGIISGFGFKWLSKIEPSFANQIKLYKSHPIMKEGIDELAETSVGHGGYWEVKNPEFEGQFIDDLDDISYDYNLDGLHQVRARELWAVGNNILERNPSKDRIDELIHLPISSFTKLKADKHGKITMAKQEIDGESETWSASDLEKVLWTKWNRIDASMHGVGLMTCMLEKGLGYTWEDANGTEHEEFRPTFAEILDQTEDSMRMVMHRYTPRWAWILEGFTDAQATNYSNKIKVLRPWDDVVMNSRSLKNQKITVVQMQADPRSRLDAFVQYFYNMAVLAVQTPTIRLFLEAGFTEASSRTAIQILDRKVDAYRRFEKRETERNLAQPLLEQEKGVSLETWKEAKIRWNWNPIDKPKVIPTDIIRAYAEGILEWNEARLYFKKADVEILFDKPQVRPHEINKMVKDLDQKEEKMMRR